MSTETQTTLTPIHDPLTLLRRMTSELDRMFEESAWPAFRWSSFRPRGVSDTATWSPGIDVFQRDNHLVTKIDLPGLKKEDVKVEATDGQLVISGERKSEAEENTDQFYRCEREYGSFYRSVPLPQGVKVEDVKATFSDGVLEVSVPLPAKPEAKMRKVEIQDAPTVAKTAA